MADPMTKGEQTRQRIVEQAAAIFNQPGYEGGLMAELMAATGLKKGGIYRYFSSKEALAAEAFDYSWRGALEARLPAGSPVQGLAWVQALVANFVTQRPIVAGGCPLLNTAVEADDGNPVLRARAVGALRGWHARIVEELQWASRRGQLRPAVDPRSMATVVIASLEGALMMSRLEGESEALKQVAAHLRTVLDDCGTEPAPSPKRAPVKGRPSRTRPRRTAARPTNRD